MSDIKRDLPREFKTAKDAIWNQTSGWVKDNKLAAYYITLLVVSILLLSVGGIAGDLFHKIPSLQDLGKWFQKCPGEAVGILCGVAFMGLIFPLIVRHVRRKSDETLPTGNGPQVVSAPPLQPRRTADHVYIVDAAYSGPVVSSPHNLTITAEPTIVYCSKDHEDKTEPEATPPVSVTIMEPSRSTERAPTDYDSLVVWNACLAQAESERVPHDMGLYLQATALPLPPPKPLRLSVQAIATAPVIIPRPFEAAAQPALQPQEPPVSPQILEQDAMVGAVLSWAAARQIPPPPADEVTVESLIQSQCIGTYQRYSQQRPIPIPYGNDPIASQYVSQWLGYSAV